MSATVLSAHCNEFGLGDSCGRVVSITSSSVGEQSPLPASCDDVRFGFAAPDDRVISLNVPASTDDGQKHPVGDLILSSIRIIPIILRSAFLKRMQTT
ncbi:hypothetical protein [Microvirga arvi]|uniref:hypothetical protein n=1 Tax=Microvirga arvi TaxID=2778731 RepID=UPI00194FD3B2|nr:hypothetical protein [Microvirga arvi]